MREGPRYDWIIAVSNSAESGIKILKTYCKVSEIKQILVDLAKRDARKDAAAFKHGTDDIDQLQVKNIGAITVQRDLYSAFLQSCMDTVEKPDRKKCIQLFDNFVKMQNDLITEMKASGKSYPSCFGF